MALYVVFLVGVLSSPDFKAKPVSNAMWPSFINSPKQTFIQQLILHQEFTEGLLLMQTAWNFRFFFNSWTSALSLLLVKTLES